MAVLDALGVDRVAVLGMSVGGAYAAAWPPAPRPGHAPSGWSRPSRQTRSQGPVEAMVEQARPEFAAWVSTRRAATPTTRCSPRAGSPRYRPRRGLLADALSPARRRRRVREALAQHDGYLRDAALLSATGAVRWEAITAPTRLWFGADDDRNPPSTGDWWADRIPHAELAVTPTTHLAPCCTNWPDSPGDARASTCPTLGPSAAVGWGCVIRTEHPVALSV